MVKLHLCRNSTCHPILDTLHATRLPEFQKLSECGSAAVFHDEVAICHKRY